MITIVGYGDSIYLYGTDQTDQADAVHMVAEAAGVDVVRADLTAERWDAVRAQLKDSTIYDMRSTGATGEEEEESGDE